MFSATTVFYALGNKKIVALCYVILTLIVLFLIVKTNIIFDRDKKTDK
jgi:hypothetical protein